MGERGWGVEGRETETDRENTVSSGQLLGNGTGKKWCILCEDES